MGPARRRQSLLPAVAVLLLAAACGTGEAGPEEPNLDGTRTPTPTVSLQEYQKDLTTALEPLSVELAGLPENTDLPALRKRLTEAEQVAQSVATDVGAMTPPPKAAKAHGRLLNSIEALRSDLAATTDAVDAQEICAPSSALADLGGGSGLSALPAAVQAMRSASVDVKLTLPKTPKAQNRRPANGTFIRSGDLSGRGELQIENGTENDTVISLALGRRPAFSVYVRKASRFAVRGVADGTYTIYYAIGTDWDRRSKAFTRHCGFKRFDQQAVFQTTYSGNAVYNTIQQIGLQPTIGGNATTSDVAPEEFPG